MGGWLINIEVFVKAIFVIYKMLEFKIFCEEV